MKSQCLELPPSLPTAHTPLPPGIDVVDDGPAERAAHVLPALAVPVHGDARVEERLRVRVLPLGVAHGPDVVGASSADRRQRTSRRSGRAGDGVRGPGRSVPVREVRTGKRLGLLVWFTTDPATHRSFAVSTVRLPTLTVWSQGRPVVVRGGVGIVAGCQPAGACITTSGLPVTGFCARPMMMPPWPCSTAVTTSPPGSGNDPADHMRPVQCTVCPLPTAQMSVALTAVMLVRPAPA